MKIKLLTDIVFEYGGTRKTMFKAGAIFEAAKAFKWAKAIETQELDGYWIGDERTPPKPGFENPGTLARTKCFTNECTVID